MKLKEFIQKTLKLNYKAIKSNLISRTKKYIYGIWNDFKKEWTSDYLDLLLLKKLLLTKIPIDSDDFTKILNFKCFRLNNEIYVIPNTYKVGGNIFLLENSSFKLDIKNCYRINNEIEYFNNKKDLLIFLKAILDNKYVDNFYLSKLKQFITHPILFRFDSIKYVILNYADYDLEPIYNKLEKLNYYDNILDEITRVLNTTNVPEINQNQYIKSLTNEQKHQIKSILEKLKSSTIKTNIDELGCLKDFFSLLIMLSNGYNLIFSVKTNYNHRLCEFDLYKYQFDIVLKDKNDNVLFTYTPFIFDNDYNLRYIFEIENVKNNSSDRKSVV